MVPPKRERLREFFRVLVEFPSAATFDEAVQQLTNILNAVEDELTGIPYDPGSWRYDDRIYPPQEDSRREVPGHPHVTRFRSVAHSTYVGVNGSIEIVSVDGAVELQKFGADGRGVWDLNPTTGAGEGDV